MSEIAGHVEPLEDAVPTPDLDRFPDFDEFHAVKGEMVDAVKAEVDEL